MFNPLLLYTPKPVNNVMVGAEGLNIEVQIKEGYAPLDISSATTKNIIIRKPISLTDLTVSGSFVSDGKDGKIYYVTQHGDLDEAGTYYIQSFINIGSFNGYSTQTSFVVLENL